MQILDLDGSARERGLEQARQIRPAYEQLLETFFGSDLWRHNKPPLIPTGIIRWLIGFQGKRNTRPDVERHLPGLAERVAGLGEGLEVSPAFAWGLQFMEVMFCEAGKSLKAPGGCTQVHAQPAATAGGAPLVGRNYDFPNLLQPFQIVRRERPSESDRLATTTVTQVALIGAHQGINEAGLTGAANNSRLWKGPDFRRKGVPYLLVMQEILETCRTTAEAVELIRSFPARTNAGFFGFTDEAGDSAIVEFTASRAEVRKPDEQGVLAQSNHYHVMTDANLPPGTYWDVEGMNGMRYFEDSTGPRFDAANRLMHEAAGSITLDTLKGVLRDHSYNDGVGADSTICCHGETGSTLASVLIDIRERTLWVADGRPCQVEYEAVPFRTGG